MSARLHLRFEIAGDPYLLPASAIVAVRPLPALKALPGAPNGVVGVALHQGRPGPVIDLSLLAGGAPAADRLSTRLVWVDYPAPGGPRLLGLVLERATEVARVEAGALVAAGAPAAAWLGGLAPVSTGEVAAGGTASPQVVEVAGLIPPELRAVLFAAADAAPEGVA